MKKRIAVLFGGCSTEYPVSLQSAYFVIGQINREMYDVYTIGITRAGEWLWFRGHADKIPEDIWMEDGSCLPVMISPNKADHGIVIRENGTVRIEYMDVVFPVLHGKNGEDGTVQGVCELAGIPLVGCGLLSSALCMDKDRAHLLVERGGIRVPRSIVLKRDSRMPQAADEWRDWLAGIGLPLFVKPVRSGSSFGITKVCGWDTVENAVQLAFTHDDEVIIEEAIEGFEVGCAIMGNEELTVGEVDEIELSQGFFDYVEKYNLKTSRIHMPARITPEQAQSIKECAVRIYRALGCRGFARVDMFLTPAGSIVFNEVNTIPGFTEHSRFPNMLKGIGMTFGDVVNRLITLALEGCEEAE